MLSDGSICGKEFVSAVLRGDKGLEAIERLCGYAKDNNWKVNRDCGLHVHFNMQGEGLEALKAIALAYYLTHDVWASCVNSERKDNHFCGKHTTGLSDIANIDNFVDFSQESYRYQWLNFAAYSKHGTFEVRIHHGSIDAVEICNWVRAHEAFIAWAKSVGFDGVKRALWVKSGNEKFDFVMDHLPNDCADYYNAKVREVCNV